MNQTIKLDTRKCDGAYGKARIAPLRRGERNNALLTVKVCANGQPYDLAGKTASLVATTAAGKLVGPCPMEVAEAGIARIMLPAALYSTVGSFSGYVEIREGDTLVDTTDRFGGKVIECADLDSEQAAEFTPLLGELQNAVAEEAKRVEAEKARAQAETERVKAEEERGKAEEKRAQDSKTRLEELAQAKTNAETATGEANTARDEAKRAATDATSAAGKATDAAGLAETAKTNANTAAEEANAAATKAEAAARKADGAAETADTAASTAVVAANKADTAAGNAEIMAEKADASANKADIAAGKANEATVAATNAATKANEVESKLTGNVLKGKVKETLVHVDDAFAGAALHEITVEGACRQDGTPSPDNPVPITVVENPVLHVTGKNTFDYKDARYLPNGYTYVDDWVKNIRSSSLCFMNVPTLEGVQGVISLIGDGGNKGNPNGLGLSAAPGKNVGYPTDKDYFMMLGLRKGEYFYARKFTATDKWCSLSTIANRTKDIQYEVGSEATAYTPYVGASQAFTLPAEHPYLAKLPDGTADEIVVDKDGNVELVARVNKIVLNGSQIFHLMDFKEFDAYYETDAIGNGMLPIGQWGGIYDRFITDNPYIFHSGACAYSFANSNGTIFRIRPSETFANAEGFNNWLKSNPVTSYYADTEPKTYNLGKINLPALPESVSNVWTDAEVTPRTGIEYVRDVNIVVANLESAIASITQG